MNNPKVLRSGKKTMHGRGSAKAICKLCSKIFKTYPCYLKDGRAKYCTKECGYTALTKWGRDKKEVHKNIIRIGELMMGYLLNVEAVQ